MDLSIADKFISPDYNKFAELVKKSSGDASLLVQNNKVIYGNMKAMVPTFRDVEYVKADLESLKVSLLLKVNDLYDKIITADEPTIYKSKYQSIVSQVQHIDLMIDEIDAYLNNVNEQKVTMPITEAHAKLSVNKNNVHQVMNATSGDVHVSKKNIKKLVELHKEGIKLEEQWKDAKNVNEVNYIIWNSKDDGKEAVVNANKNVPVETTSSTSSRKLSVAKKAVIKKATKKVMLQKLS